MREFLDDIAQGSPLDPVEATRRSLNPGLRKRFYQQAHWREEDRAFAVLLDGKPVRTPARRLLATPSQALAQALADEWDMQRDVIDPAAMPLTRLANSIIDGVVAAAAPVMEEIVRYLGSDLLFYRAEAPPGLVEMQARHWDPVLAWVRETLGARFVLAEGLVFVAQPDHAVDAARRVIPNDPWRLGAIHSVMTLTGSALLALALEQGKLTAEQAWTAAHVDEDWNMLQWGSDEAALARRAHRHAEMLAAATILKSI